MKRSVIVLAKEKKEEEEEEEVEVERWLFGGWWPAHAGRPWASQPLQAQRSRAVPSQPQLQTRCTLPCDPQLLQVHPPHHLLLTPPPLPASPPAMSSSGRCRQLSQCVGGRPQYSQCRPQ